jgi:hypothetical protein
MIKTLKIIAAELKRANDLKERDIKNKETWGWYTRPSVPNPDSINYSSVHGISTTTTGLRSDV